MQCQEQSSRSAILSKFRVPASYTESHMPKLYRYVGPSEIRQRNVGKPVGLRVASAKALTEWLQATGQEMSAEGVVGVTFVVDEEGWLRVADRHSEHVACAGGGPVLSAGE